MPTMRPSWDETWLSIAHTMAERTTCRSGRAVGAVAVRDKRQIASGYNGVPSGVDHPTRCIRREQKIPSGHSPHLCGCQHAESNLVASAARFGIPLEGATVYLTCSPCIACVGMLAHAGVIEVVYADAYPDDAALRIGAQSGILLRKA
jgi:dCMP deaminase